MSQTSECVICGAKSTHFGCGECVHKMRTMLKEIPEFYALAAGEYWPEGGSTDGGSNERSIGLRVDCLDGRAPREAIFALEAWERDWRETLTTFANGDEVASGLAQRQRKATAWSGSESMDLLGVTLTGVCHFLDVHLAIAAKEHPAIDEFHKELTLAHKTARRAAREGNEAVTIVLCPADKPGGGLCRVELILTTAEITCPACATVWSQTRLLAVARAADVDTWQPAAVVSQYLGIPGSTLRRWARDGSVKRRGHSYLWSSVVKHQTQLSELA